MGCLAGPAAQDEPSSDTPWVCTAARPCRSCTREGECSCASKQHICTRLWGPCYHTSSWDQGGENPRT